MRNIFRKTKKESTTETQNEFPHKYFFSYAHSFDGGNGFGSLCMSFKNPFNPETDSHIFFDAIKKLDGKTKSVVILNFIKYDDTTNIK